MVVGGNLQSGVPWYHSRETSVFRDEDLDVLLLWEAPMARHGAGTKPMLGAPLGHNFAVSVACQSVLCRIVEKETA